MTWRCLLCEEHGYDEDPLAAYSAAVWHEIEEHEPTKENE